MFGNGKTTCTPDTPGEFAGLQRAADQDLAVFGSCIG
jgi:hypothetical protein